MAPILHHPRCDYIGMVRYISVLPSLALHNAISAKYP